MRRPITIIIVLILFGKLFYCQNLDSIYISIADIPPEDQIKVLTDFTWKWRSSHPQEALIAGQRAIKIAEEKKLTSFLPQTLNSVGVVLRNIGELESSYDYYRRALKLAVELEDSSQIAYSHNNIGGYYRLIGSYSKAIEYIIKALKIFESIDDDCGIAFCAINVGILMRRQNNYESALNYLNRTIEIRERLEDKHGLALALNQIAEIHFEQNKLSQAIRDYDNLLTLYLDLRDEKGIAAVYAGMGGIYYEQNNYELSLEYRNKAIEIDRRIGNKFGITTNLNNIGRLCTKLGRYNEAQDYLQQALVLTKESGFYDIEMETYFYLSEYYLERGNYKKAYEYKTSYYIVRDSLFNKEKTDKINDIRLAYETGQKEVENKILRNELKYDRVFRYLSLTIFLLLLGMFIINWRRYKNHKEANKLLRELNDTKDKFFKILAHDLKNPFNTIMGYSEILIEDFYSMHKEEKLRLIKDMNLSARNLFRLLENLLKWVHTQTGTLQLSPVKINLFDSVENVVELFRNVSAEKKLKVYNRTNKEHIVLVDEDTLNFILRNIVNNAIKFSKNEGEIIIDSAISGKKALTISVKDNGVGIREEDKNKIFSLEKIHSTQGTENETGTGLGLVLVKEFVDKNGGEIWFESEKALGTTFFFTLPSA